MDGSTLTAPVSLLLPVQAQVFEAVATTSMLAGPIQDLAHQFGVTPVTFIDCLGELISVGWVIVTATPEGILTIQLDRDGRFPT